MALINKLGEQIKHKKEKLRELVKETGAKKEDKVEELVNSFDEDVKEVWRAPDYLPHSIIETDGMDMESYFKLLAKIKRAFGTNYQDNIEFLRLYGSRDKYEKILLTNMVQLDQSRAPGNPIGSSILDRLHTRKNRP